MILISFLGIIAGYILYMLAPEEIKPGNKYFWMLYNMLLALLLGWIAYTFNAAAGAFVFLVSSILLMKKRWTKYLYPFTGLAFFVYHEYTAAIVFLIGMVLPALETTHVIDEKAIHKVRFLILLLKRNFWFGIFALLPFLMTKL